jgi:hypothetical protein
MWRTDQADLPIINSNRLATALFSSAKYLYRPNEKSFL